MASDESLSGAYKLQFILQHKHNFSKQSIDDSIPYELAIYCDMYAQWVKENT